MDLKRFKEDMVSDTLWEEYSGKPNPCSEHILKIISTCRYQDKETILDMIDRPWVSGKLILREKLNERLSRLASNSKLKADFD